MAGRREFQFGKGNSRKFWAVELQGTSLTVHFGRIGNVGQTQSKQFASKLEAKKSYDKLIAEKVKKGYREGKSVEEDEWLKGKNASEMLEKIPIQLSARKYRLYACASARRLWNLYIEATCHDAIAIAERFADMQVGKAERQAARRAVGPVPGALDTTKIFRVVARATLDDNARWGAIAISNFSPLAVEFAKGAKARTLEKRQLAPLLRHIVGNPFRPYPKPASWPSTVVQLAESLYHGQNCRLPLSDALEEAGHSELAEHFRKEEWHPKGCWAMDLILGKEPR